MRYVIEQYLAHYVDGINLCLQNAAEAPATEVNDVSHQFSYDRLLPDGDKCLFTGSDVKKDHLILLVVAYVLKY